MNDPVCTIPLSPLTFLVRSMEVFAPGAAASERDLIEFCRARIAHFKCPKAIAFAELPKTSTGKIQKFILREKEWAGKVKRVN